MCFSVATERRRVFCWELMVVEKINFISHRGTETLRNVMIIEKD